MRIALDFHDVLADLKTAVVGHLNKKHGLSLTTSDLTTWKCWEHGPFTKAQFYDAVNASKNAGLAPLPGALDGVRRILAAGHKVSIVSGTRDPHGIALWLERHGLPKVNVYAVVAERLSDAKLALDFDVYVDDNPAMVEGPCGSRVLLFAQPWNKDVPEYIERVSGWPEVLAALEVA